MISVGSRRAYRREDTSGSSRMSGSACTVPRSKKGKFPGTTPPGSERRPRGGRRCRFSLDTEPKTALSSLQIARDFGSFPDDDTRRELSTFLSTSENAPAIFAASEALDRAPAGQHIEVRLTLPGRVRMDKL